jgi:hypothetical protein
MTGSAAHELLTVYCAACTLNKYLPVERLEAVTICRTTTIAIIIIIIAIIT